MKIKREDIVKAIRTENLVAGMFFRHVKEYKTCAVCAVGAVLKNCVPNYIPKTIFNEEIKNLLEDHYSESDLDAALKSENYLAQLSCIFEYAYYYFDSDELVKDHLVAYVETFFPKTITINEKILLDK